MATLEIGSLSELEGEYLGWTEWDKNEDQEYNEIVQIIHGRIEEIFSGWDYSWNGGCSEDEMWRATKESINAKGITHIYLPKSSLDIENLLGADYFVNLPQNMPTYPCEDIYCLECAKIFTCKK